VSQLQPNKKFGCDSEGAYCESESNEIEKYKIENFLEHTDTHNYHQRRWLGQLKFEFTFALSELSEQIIVEFYGILRSVGYV
jgi:hypothetical protein